MANFFIFQVFPCPIIPKYDRIVCSDGFSLILLIIFLFVAVRNPRWWGKCTLPSKSTPEDKVLMKTLSGCKLSFNFSFKNTTIVYYLADRPVSRHEMKTGNNFLQKPEGILVFTWFASRTVLDAGLHKKPRLFLTSGVKILRNQDLN